MQEKPVIVNNTPLVALWELDHFSLLRDLYTEVWIPSVVEDEFLKVDSTARRASLESATWIKTVRLRHSQRTFTDTGLHRGESSVLALAVEYNARLVIIDERKARLYAQRIGLQVTGTIGVLLIAKENRLIGEIKPLINRLHERGLYMSSTLIDKALRLAGEID